MFSGLEISGSFSKLEVDVFLDSIQKLMMFSLFHNCLDWCDTDNNLEIPERPTFINPLHVQCSGNLKVARSRTY